ncbi:TRAP transporter permease [Natronococcus sp. JC468]|uniref:TRAP transporter permease n=1 Tax=Natronococcus sp. JC468 TaxID=1961921 RepID=UPI00143AC7F8|nr:TRAP transporter fused permease subunit [Natronococcus sp. JC468]NKE36952.1 TRAP transporter permease [Natronococcus sp. JC468]
MSVDREDEETLSDEEQQQLMEEVQRRRSHRGPAIAIVSLIAIAFSAFQMWIAARGYAFEATLPFVGEYRLVGFQQLQINAIHVAFGLVLAFLLFPTSRGDGFLARRLGRIEPAVGNRLGDDHPVTRATARISGAVGWFFLDPEMNRIAPVDVLLAVLAVLPAYYTATQYDEIQRIAVLRFEDTQTLPEIFPVLVPFEGALSAVGVPIADVSAAFVLAVLGMALVLEATRRALGLVLASLVALFIAYARWGYLVPQDSAIGALWVQPDNWANIMYNLWYTVEAGVHSQPVSVSVRFIYIFILFGAFLEMSGAGKWFIDLAYSATGTRKGGPAKASVVSSGFMGMLSGSSIANTVTTGAFTIPLMKRSGYSPEFSGAVESSSSSGGQMLPPVMGAAAFLIVEFTGTPYADVIIAATLPALAFFFGMWVMVHFEAVRGDIGGLSRSELPDVRSALRTGWFYLIPLALLLYYLVIARLSINRSGWLTIVAVVALLAVVAAYDERTRGPLFATIAALFAVQAGAYATIGAGIGDAVRSIVGLGGMADADPMALEAALSAAVGDLAMIALLVGIAFVLLRPRAEAPLLEFDDEVEAAAERSAAALGRPALSGNRAYRFGNFLLKSMDSGARTATTVVVAVAAAGVVPGVISVSGLGPNLAALIGDISGDSMLILLTLTGVAAIIFGMGMPTTAMYIILVAMLEAPLVEAGVVVLAAHLFVLYWGLMADVTPPVAVAAFAGAGVAKAEEMKTASLAFLLSLNKVLVPFAFVFSPGILFLRDGEVAGWTDVTDLGYVVPEIVIPVFGMFVGVYALGVTIIGYQYARVTPTRRALYSVASILLMVPEIPLLLLEGVLALAGVPSALTIFELTAALRGIGLAMLAALTYRNRSRADLEEADARPSATAAGDA